MKEERNHRSIVSVLRCQTARALARTSFFFIIILAQLSFFESRIDKCTSLTDCGHIRFSSLEERRKPKTKKERNYWTKSFPFRSNSNNGNDNQSMASTMNQGLWASSLEFDLSSIRLWFSNTRAGQAPIHKQQYNPHDVWNFENEWSTTLCSCKPRGRCKSQSIPTINALWERMIPSRLLFMLLLLLYRLHDCQISWWTTDLWLSPMLRVVSSNKAANSAAYQSS